MRNLLLSLYRILTLALLILTVMSCASTPKPPEVQPAPEPSKPTVVMKRVPEYVSDLQIEMAARDLFSLAGLEPRDFQFASKAGVLSVTGTHESSRSLNNAIALLQRIKGVKQVSAEIESGTVSGTTQPPAEETGLFMWFLQLFWPILALIGAAFVAIGFLFYQTKLIAKQIQKKRELESSRA